VLGLQQELQIVRLERKEALRAMERDMSVRETLLDIIARAQREEQVQRVGPAAFCSFPPPVQHRVGSFRAVAPGFFPSRIHFSGNGASCGSVRRLVRTSLRQELLPPNPRIMHADLLLLREISISCLPDRPGAWMHCELNVADVVRTAQHDRDVFRREALSEAKNSDMLRHKLKVWPLSLDAINRLVVACRSAEVERPAAQPHFFALPYRCMAAAHPRSPYANQEPYRVEGGWSVTHVMITGPSQMCVEMNGHLLQ
jgi:hypothetical protein